MNRRELIALLGSTAVLSWPGSARAQPAERVRRIGVLLPAAADDLEYQARLGALVEGLARLGWISGHNLRVDVRWAIGDTEHFGREAEKLLGAEPDVIVASSSLAVAALQKASRTVPIVFGAVVDPVGSGFVASWARPGGNIQLGFTNFEYGLSGKWLELLKELAPGTTQAAVLRDVVSPAEIGMFAAIQSAAPSIGLELNPIGMREARGD